MLQSFQSFKNLLVYCSLLVVLTSGAFFLDLSNARSSDQTSLSEGAKVCLENPTVHCLADLRIGLAIQTGDQEGFDALFNQYLTSRFYFDIAKSQRLKELLPAIKRNGPKALDALITYVAQYGEGLDVSPP